jgi:hypothetical protein
MCRKTQVNCVLKKQRACNALGTAATGGPESPLQPPSGKQSQFSIPFLGIANAFSGPHLHCTWSLKEDKKRRKPKANWLVYLQLNKKKAKAEGKKCHAKTMWSQ